MVVSDFELEAMLQFMMARKCILHKKLLMNADVIHTECCTFTKMFDPFT